MAGIAAARRRPPAATGARAGLRAVRSGSGVANLGAAVARPASGDRRRDRLRGPSLPAPHRARRPRQPARAGHQRAFARRASGRQHDHAAARPRAVPRPRAHGAAEAHRDSARGRARDRARQERDPRDVPELRVLGAGAGIRRGRDRRGGALVLRRSGRVADRARGRHAGGDDPGAQRLRSVRAPARGGRAPQLACCATWSRPRRSPSARLDG